MKGNSIRWLIATDAFDMAEAPTAEALRSVVAHHMAALTPVLGGAPPVEVQVRGRNTEVSSLRRILASGSRVYASMLSPPGTSISYWAHCVWTLDPVHHAIPLDEDIKLFSSRA
jgi:hypothetical protein